MWISRLSAYEVKKDEARHHANESTDAQLTLGAFSEGLHDAFHERRVEEGHDAFEHEIKRERRKQI
jgi:hypothetical protein